ncbi:hypothetical protein GCM10009741_57930 [Kribbella lupini]|uniref:Uncharacterized protein n=1 Tax=Kribbella lupini TaxID=291602 RepID=A0ABN2BV65_9ACTN
MLTADRPAVGRSAQSRFTLRQAERGSSAPQRPRAAWKPLSEFRPGTEQAPGSPPAEPLGFPSEWPRRRSGSLLALTLEGRRRAGKAALSTPVDNSVGKLWGAPRGAVDERGNRV